MAIVEEQESWAVSRMGGLGGTDVTAILGMSKWRSPIEVWQAKVDPASVPPIDNEILWFGRAMEPVIRARYAIRFQCQVVDPANLGTIFPNSSRWEDQTIVRGKEPWMLGAADGWVPHCREGLEIKNVGFKTDEWGDEGSGDIPGAYFCQSSWYGLVYDAAGWSVAPLFSGHKLCQYKVPRDSQLEKDMYEVARAFWFDYVVPRVEPPIDQTESYGRYLARKFSLSTGQIITNPSQEILDYAAEMKAAAAEKERWEAREREANNHLRALVGNAQKCATPLGTIGWVRPEMKPVTDWKAATSDLAKLYDDARSQFATSANDVIQAHTEDKQGTAYLRAWWKK